jgi:predicted enzyme related to lactoylglutathione lyase
MKISRIILFVKDVEKVAMFYKEAFDLKLISDINSEWIELDVGGCNLAFHKTKDRTLKNKTKIVFGTSDVFRTKKLLEEKGIKLGKVSSIDNLNLCNGKDPEGNIFQISDRK